MPVRRSRAHLMAVLLAGLPAALAPACAAGPPAVGVQPGGLHAVTPPESPWGGPRVVTFNIHAGTDHERRPALPLIAALIDTLAANVVFLQEVDRGTRRSGGVDQLAVLAEYTGMHSAFARAMEYDGGEYGTALLSRYPLREVRTVPLPVVVPAELSARYYEPRVLLHAVAATPRGELHLLGTHLAHGREPVFRHTEMVELLAYLAEAVPPGVPVVLAGDLNAAPDRPEIRALGLALRDAWPLCGEGDGFTFPAGAPRTRIDYVFLRGYGCLRAVVVPTLASDHLPLVVDLRVEGP